MCCDKGVAWQEHENRLKRADNMQCWYHQWGTRRAGLGFVEVEAASLTLRQPLRLEISTSNEGSAASMQAQIDLAGIIALAEGSSREL